MEQKCSKCGRTITTTANLYYIKKEYSSRVTGQVYFQTAPVCFKCYHNLGVPVPTVEAPSLKAIPPLQTAVNHPIT
jgi:hypothetical protein